jgi:hypothetical protein
MEPVRLGYYGLFRVTRRTYLVLQVLTGIGLFVLFCTAIWLRGEQETLENIHHDSWWIRLLRLAARHLLWVTLALTALVVLEIMWYLRRFAQKEAEQRAHLPLPEEPGPR